MTYKAKLLFVIIGFLLSLSSCKGDKTGEGKISPDSINIDDIGSTVKENVSDLKPKEMIFLVEGAVDTWFFYNLDNYASYEAIMRNTEYDSIRNIHIHHVRFRSMNKDGGYETTEKTFEVSFTLNEKDVPEFNVKEIPMMEKKFTLDSRKK